MPNERCSSVPITDTLTVAGSPEGRDVTASTTAEVTPETASINALRLLNWLRSGADSMSAFSGG
jgi:hypothetical protein